MNKFLKKNQYSITIIIIIVIRLFLNAILPLMDKTEARYAEIARIMFETGNWIIPQIDYGVPFWAKPPLSIWLNALSFHVFGVNEFAVRFPSFLLSLLIWLVLSKLIYSKNEKLILGLVLFTLPQFLLHAGVVSTDMTLLFSICLVMVGFYKQITFSKKTYWGFLIFIGFGLGLLAKGPIVFVLTLPVLFLWVLWFNQWKSLWKKIPILSGILITFLIAVPWYYLAEKATPGFIDYFIVGEHLKRFVDASWDGDKYGFAKQQPMGIIWLFLILFSLPWIAFLLFRSLKRFKLKTIIKRVSSKKYVLYLVLWLVWTPLFFTSSKSLIHTYMLPCTLPLALLVVHFWKYFSKSKTNISIAFSLPLLAFLLGIVALNFSLFKTYANSDKYLVKNNIDKKLFYLQEKTYSSQFYSQGNINVISANDFKTKNYPDEDFLLLVRKKILKRQKNLDLSNFQKIEESNQSVLYKFITHN
ncbi:ArnT family glycosyltransferase [Psychroflexus salis]|uniref:Phospholipid carrier-dependent glycosyltransferase n=1 Tax=Psychroflexus salis TaxID=1526574 RepID=A0A916ZP56_9FLAO|nr:glycosyltransferase family 39 protein [Psychroflexus salis]GGE07335.1 phospholipid carrier-dependent glycosyltransferase [Psychroflexus salis]